MTDRWLVEISGLRLGPLERAEVEEMINSGEIRLDDRVCAEGSDDWRRASHVFADDDDEVFLAAPAPANHQLSSAGPASVSAETVARGTSNRQFDNAAPPAPEEPTEAYFYIQRDGDEVGPLTLPVLQEFVDDGLLQPETRIRGEDDPDWTTAEQYGFEFPAPEPDVVEPAAATKRTTDDAGQRVYGGLLWLVFAPFYFLTSGSKSMAGLSRRQLAFAAAVVFLVGYAGMYVARNWSQTALRGTITLDGEPLPDVMIVLNGAATGDSGTGISNGSGHFRIVTIDGELAPGEYHVTIRRLASADTPDAVPIPERFQVLGRSDVVVEVTETTTFCEIALSSKHRLKRNRGFMGGGSAEATVD